jgi:hypothetical protein
MYRSTKTKVNNLMHFKKSDKFLNNNKLYSILIEIDNIMMNYKNHDKIEELTKVNIEFEKIMLRQYYRSGYKWIASIITIILVFVSVYSGIFTLWSYGFFSLKNSNELEKQLEIDFF